jgi:MarR family transcriptional repressor of emrRAB
MAVESPPLSSLLNRIAEIEGGMQCNAARIRGFPLTEAMILRIFIMMGRELSALLEDSLRAEGLSETDFRTLLVLLSRPDGVANPSELCACLAQSPANMTRVADALVERGLITRLSSAEDRRRMILRLTSAGEALARELLPDKIKAMRALFGDLSASERQQLLALLKRVCAEIDRFAASGSEA